MCNTQLKLVIKFVRKHVKLIDIVKLKKINPLNLIPYILTTFACSPARFIKSFS